MDSRQKQLFKNIVDEHIKTARAVASAFLVDKYRLDVCPATVRNDMLDLEKEGLIEHPHTSAGRRPTESGYRFFINEFVDFDKCLNKNDQAGLLKSVNKSENFEILLKSLAKAMAEKSNLGVFIGFSKDSVYYTGLSYLFNQPEFRDYDLILNMTEVIDHLDDAVVNIYRELDDKKMLIKIGNENPFSKECATIITKAKDILFGILGPIRMDYQKNIELINFAKNFIKN